MLPPGLKVWGVKNSQIEAFTIQGHGPRIVKTFEFELLVSKNFEFESFNMGPSVMLPGC